MAEIALAVGSAVGGAFLNVLFERLASRVELLKKNKHDGGLLKKLGNTLVGLQIVLSDAENKQASNQHVRQWLNKLQSAVDSAENLMEQVHYEALKLHVEGQHQNLAETCNQQVGDLNLSLSHDVFLKIKEKLEDAFETLEDLERQISRVGLQKYFDSGKKLEIRTLSTSVVDESEIFGREIEIERLIDCLLSNDAKGKNLTVVPIVGMGGLGKTTLAKAAYNDKMVTDHFELKAWTCVSEPYDVLRISKELLQEIDSFDSKYDNNLDRQQVKLKEKLNGKRFLIVLDDMWNENYEKWDELRSLFVQGAAGSKIIVTTRKENVARTMGSGVVNVGTLSSEASWALFKRHSLDNRDPKEHPKLEEVGKQIAVKCKGLPLALKAIAGILRCKSEVDEWKDILRSEIWEQTLNDILPALMLSYNDLPAHLKQCFAFCAIYPKDYQFCKEQVIHLWIANGLVQPLHSGRQYFDELRSRSLFERAPESSERYGEKFLMHDLVNDLAQTASSKLCVRLEECQGFHMLEQCQHMSYSMGRGGDFEKLKPLSKSEKLRTLLPINTQGLCCPKLSERVLPKLSKRVLYNILPSLRSLRALSLSGYGIVEMPNDLFIKLKLLRFLDLSWTEIIKLPDSICALYNLTTLLLSSCRYLEELPLQIEKLVNLRHLDISNTFHLKMPLHLSKLKSLQVFVGAKFLLGGLRMEDLGQLHNLYGSLSILELQNVVDNREALKAKMRKKEHVEKLSLKWSRSIADNSQTERDILDELRPHSNIKKLRISGYRGTQFPNWLADPSFLKLLVRLSLSKCKDCFSLPALGQLPSLKSLSIRGMHRITEVTEEFYGSLSSEKPFNSLEELEFAQMPEWKQWHVLGIGEFPALQDLSIKDCPKLLGKLPENLCSLTKLRISTCPELNLETPIQLSSLKRFEVDNSPKAGVVFDEAEVFTSQLEGMKQIARLYLTDCNSLTSLPTSTLPSTLKTISIVDCRKLKLEAPDSSKMNSNMFLEELTLVGCDSISSTELVPRARHLTVWSCQNLARFLIPNGTERVHIALCENLEILLVACGTQMTPLHIIYCKKLKRLPEGMQELLPSLKELRLYGCPEIEAFPDGGLPFNLQLLRIEHCKKLVNGRKEWRLQRLPSLRELEIYHDGSDEEIVGGENWELPCSIQSLTTGNLKTLSSQVLKSLNSLESLDIRNLPQIQSLLEQGLPSFLYALTIKDCFNLQSLPESALPSSLSELTIENCPYLQSLPVKGMPSSLSKLSIDECPLLEPLLEFDKGEYWPEIANISSIYSDWVYL
ncbi:putative disease resistance RPP13-like protein 1 [Capsicum annuum]|uniref:putative disease resistance RPP13-like protein 1 n=1 Tax=Capsicum annuum TaxID=4072 RepID=UPI001FB1219C|nr:putative disease resistance RPP13-like protein 1 [Capsicum annuum]XP_047255983.1 putative disease resistance RPP13-like protein 1 [Capsicum annuum]XP_047255984.1 putative disease resistance RPP13-like protein 1 [Capsicum annuum]